MAADPMASYHRSFAKLCDELVDALAEKRPLRPLAEVMQDEPGDEGAPECLGGCGRECDHPEEVAPNGSWTCTSCEAEAERERAADERDDR